MEDKNLFIIIYFYKQYLSYLIDLINSWKRKLVEKGKFNKLGHQGASRPKFFEN